MGKALIKIMRGARDGGLLPATGKIPLIVDEDMATPSEKQFLRLRKSVAFLQDPDLECKLSQALLLTRPARLFIDKLSKLEAARAKLEFQRIGVAVDSAHSVTEDDVLASSLEFLSGRRT